jgi:hypothetical protein
VRTGRTDRLIDVFDRHPDHSMSLDLCRCCTFQR